MGPVEKKKYRTEGHPPSLGQALELVRAILGGIKGSKSLGVQNQPQRGWGSDEM